MFFPLLMKFGIVEKIKDKEFIKQEIKRMEASKVIYDKWTLLWLNLDDFRIRDKILQKQSLKGWWKNDDGRIAEDNKRRD